MSLAKPREEQAARKRITAAEYLFGFDIFISYARADAKLYAETLEAKLASRDLTVFRDLTNLDSGEQLNPAVNRAVRRSRRFVLIDTPGARASQWVAKEIESFFLKRVGGLISIRGSDVADGQTWLFVTDRSLWKRIDEFVWEAESLDALSSGNPSERVVERIRLAASNLRVRVIYRSAVVVTILLLIGLLITSLIQTERAIAQRELAEARLLASQSELAIRDNPLAVENSALLAAESARHVPLIENDARMRQTLQILPRSITAFQVAGADDTSGGYKGVAGLAVSPDGHTGIVTTQNGRVLAYRFPSGKLPWDQFPSTKLLWEQRQQGDVNGIAFSPDGKLVATASDGPDLLIRLAADGSKVRHVPGSWTGQALSFSPDGHRLAASAEDSVQLIDADSGEVIWTAAHRDVVNSIAFSRNGKWVASASADEFVNVMEASSGRIVKAIRHPSIVNAVEFSPDSRFLASGSSDKKARLMTAPRWEVTRLLDHADSVQALAFSPDSTELATASQDKIARVFDTGTGTLLAQFAHQDQVLSVAFDATGRFLATSADRAVRVFDLFWNAEVARGAFGYDAKQAVFIPGTQTVFAADYHGYCRLFEVDRFSDLGVFRHTGSPRRATFNDDGSVVALAGFPEAAAVYQVGANQERLVPDASEVTWLSYGPRRLLVLGTYRTGIRLLEPSSSTTALAAAGYSAAGSFSSDGKVLAVLSANQQIDLFTVAGPALRRISTIPYGRPLLNGAPSPAASAAIALGPNDQQIAVAGEGGWGELLALNPTHVIGDLKSDGAISALSFSRDGQHLLIGDSLGNLREAAAANVQVEFGIHHEERIAAIAISRSGGLYATAAGHEVRVFSVPRSTEVNRIPLRASALALAWGPGDAWLRVLVAKDDHVGVEQHELAESRLLSHVCDSVQRRGLSPDEWRRYLGSGSPKNTCPVGVPH